MAAMSVVSKKVAGHRCPRGCESAGLAVPQPLHAAKFFFDACLRDHASVAHKHNIFESEPLAHLAHPAYFTNAGRNRENAYIGTERKP